MSFRLLNELSFAAGVNAPPGAAAAWWCQEKEEEVLHHPQEEQAQEEEGQAGCAQILQGRKLAGGHMTSCYWGFFFWSADLTFFFSQVDENGKIHRLRRECPADECGAGVFMASHFDRHYCGKCCLTYCFNKPEDK